LLAVIEDVLKDDGVEPSREDILDRSWAVAIGGLWGQLNLVSCQQIIFFFDDIHRDAVGGEIICEFPAKLSNFFSIAAQGEVEGGLFEWGELGKESRSGKAYIYSIICRMDE
jgi:hypothetical protein